MSRRWELVPIVGPLDVAGVNPEGWVPPAGVSPQQWPVPSEIDAPLVCCGCGVSTPLADAATHVEVRRGWDLVFPPGRFCRGCEPLARHMPGRPPASVVAGLVDPDDPAAVEVFRALRTFSELGDWTHPWHAGFVDRWAFVDKAIVADIVDEVHVRLAPHASRWGTGCAACGVAKSREWGEDSIAGRTGGYHAVCQPCLVALRGHPTANTPGWIDRVAAVAAGLISPPRPGFAEDIGFRAYFAAAPGKPGTPDRWGFLGGELQRLRDWAARRWPALLPGADREAIAREAAERDRADAVQRGSRPGLLLGEVGRS